MKLSNATDVTGSAGLAVPTSELNATIDGTVRNDIEKIKPLYSMITVGAYRNVNVLDAILNMRTSMLIFSVSDGATGIPTECSYSLGIAFNRGGEKHYIIMFARNTLDVYTNTYTNTKWLGWQKLSATLI